MQDVFDELYSGSSGRDKGTLFQLKNYFNHRNVTNNVKEAFNYDEEFLEFCTEGYLILAAMHMMDIKALGEIPKQYPENSQERLDYMHKITTQIVDMIYISSQPIVENILNSEQSPTEDSYQFCVCKTEIPGANMVYCDNKNCPRGVWFHLDCVDMEEDDIPEGKWYCCDECRQEKASKRNKRRKKVIDNFIDSKRNYTLRLLWRGMNQLVRRDAIRENDGERMLLHWKFDMLQFYEKHPKVLSCGTQIAVFSKWCCIKKTYAYLKVEQDCKSPWWTRKKYSYGSTDGVFQ